MAKEIEVIEALGAIGKGYNILTGGQKGHSGRSLDKLHRKRQGDSKKAYWQSEEGQARRKAKSEEMMGNEFNKGRVPHNKGKIGEFKHTEDSKEKMSKALKGRVRTPEHRKNISEAKKASGWKPSPEHVEAARQARLGKPTSANQKAAAKATFAQTWLVTHPDGREEVVYSLRPFCKEHGLSQGNLATYGHTKGYKARKYETDK